MVVLDRHRRPGQRATGRANDGFGARFRDPHRCRRFAVHDLGALLRRGAGGPDGALVSREARGHREGAGRPAHGWSPALAEGLHEKLDALFDAVDTAGYATTHQCLEGLEPSSEELDSMLAELQATSDMRQDEGVLLGWRGGTTNSCTSR